MAKSSTSKQKRRGIQDTEFLGRFVDPGFLSLTVLGFIVTVAAVVTLAPDPDHDMWWYLALFAAPTLPTLWSVFAAAAREKEMGPRIALVFGRLLGLPFLLSIPMALAGMITVVLPPVAHQIAAVRASGVHMVFPEENGPAAAMVFVLVGLVGGLAAMLTGFLALFLVIIPWAAVRQPSEVAAVAVFDERLFHAPQGKAVGRAFAAVMICVIMIPTFMVVGAKYMSAHTYAQAVPNALRVFTNRDRCGARPCG